MTQVIWLVAYSDCEGPYAAAFSDVKDAHAFAAMVDDSQIIETTIDAHTFQFSTEQPT